MSDRITLVRWRRTKTDTPTSPEINMSQSVWASPGGTCVWAKAVAESPSMYPLWCKPVPPGEDALTLDDLVVLLHVFDMAWDSKAVPLMREDEASAYRLRRAIEALEGEHE